VPPEGHEKQARELLHEALDAWAEHNNFKKQEALLSEFIQRYPHSRYISKAVRHLNASYAVLSHDRDASTSLLRWFVKNHPDEPTAVEYLPRVVEDGFSNSIERKAYIDSLRNEYPNSEIKKRADRLLDDPKFKKYFQEDNQEIK
jgi:TolA-binding protein